MNRIEELKSQVSEITEHVFYVMCDENKDMAHNKVKSWLEVENYLNNISSFECKVLLSHANETLAYF